MNTHRRSYYRPYLPDMRPDGTPVPQTLRASQAGQIHTTGQVDTEPVRLRRSLAFPRPVLLITIWMTVFLLLFAVALVWVFPWVTNLGDQWHYGDTRITQLDADVGHGGTSHFLAQYYQSQILLIEIPMHDPMHLHVYDFPMYKPFSSPPVISLIVKDYNQDGRLDLGLQIKGEGFTYVLYNNGTLFQTSPPTQ